jgi:hypothetical protein
MSGMPSEAIFDGYQCEICGLFHAGQYISVACDEPDSYAQLKDNEKKSRAHLGTDDCVIDGGEYYLRGVIELPIIGLDEVFLWGAWTRVWERDYEEFAAHFEATGREKIIGPYKGRLGNRLPGYDLDSRNLKCTIQVQPVGRRPLVVIEEPEHPLAIEQRSGISLTRARQISAIARHNAR